MRACKKHTQYHVLGMLSFLAGHMIDLAVNVLLLRLWPRLVSCSRNRLPVGALPGKVAHHVALKTFTDTRVSLGWGILHRLSYWTRWLLELQIRLLLLHIQSSCLLLTVLRLKTRHVVADRPSYVVRRPRCPASTDFLLRIPCYRLLESVIVKPTHERLQSGVEWPGGLAGWPPPRPTGQRPLHTASSCQVHS
jgi:hypothetical protein